MSDQADRERLYDVIAEITQLLLGDFDERDALRLIARKAREVFGARVGAVLLTDKDDLVIVALDGPAELQEYVGTRVAGLNQVVHGDRVTVVDIPEIAPLGPALVAPLPPASSAAGGLFLVSAEPGAAVDDGDELVRMFAAQATLALDRSQAQREHSMIAVLEDRDRIARDLHDLVIQRLFATGLQLQAIHRMVNTEVQERIDRAIVDIDSTIRDLRAAIFELHHHPARRSLRSDLQALVTEYAEPLGFRARLTCTGPLDGVVPLEVRPELLATIREALSNVVRHAEATEVDVEVTVTATEVISRVADNGIGFTDGENRSGLRNLQERAEALGGAVRLQRVQPQGTVLELRVPLAEPRS
ncbi:MAG TPA: sensor histidine kinase [Kribbella sp.]|nr:sensor histidine kinase [Kribbella sp.]